MTGNSRSEKNYSFRLEAWVEGNGQRHLGYLAIRQTANPLEGLSLYGTRLDIPGSFQSHRDLSAAADKLYARFLRGDISPPIVEHKEKYQGYRITGKVRFKVGELKWEPVLELKKMQEPNKGLRQTVSGIDTPFPRNLFDTPENAALFAFDYGKRMVMGLIQGLKI